MKYKWKNDAPYAVCLTHDVDRIEKKLYHYCYYGLKKPAVHLKSLWNKWGGSEPYWNFYYLAELEEKWGFHSTFLFLNEKIRKLDSRFMGRYNIYNPKVMDIIKELDNRGFEIGLHGSYYSYNDLERLKREKEVLEEILGHPVVSTRQHYLNFSDKATWKIQNNIGLKYDSTAGCSEKIGADFPLFPYLTEEGIMEMPITFMDTVSLGMADNRKMLYEAYESRAKNNGLIVLNFHQCHFNKNEYPQNVEIYEYLLKKAANDKAFVGTMKEIGEWCYECI